MTIKAAIFSKNLVGVFNAPIFKDMAVLGGTIMSFFCMVYSKPLKKPLPKLRVFAPTDTNS